MIIDFLIESNKTGSILGLVRSVYPTLDFFLINYKFYNDFDFASLSLYPD